MLHSLVSHTSSRASRLLSRVSRLASAAFAALVNRAIMVHSAPQENYLYIHEMELMSCEGYNGEAAEESGRP